MTETKIELKNDCSSAELDGMIEDYLALKGEIYGPDLTEAPVPPDFKQTNNKAELIWRRYSLPIKLQEAEKEVEKRKLENIKECIISSMSGKERQSIFQKIERLRESGKMAKRTLQRYYAEYNSVNEAYCRYMRMSDGIKKKLARKKYALVFSVFSSLLFVLSFLLYGVWEFAALFASVTALLLLLYSVGYFSVCASYRQKLDLYLNAIDKYETKKREIEALISQKSAESDEYTRKVNELCRKYGDFIDI